LSERAIAVVMGRAIALIEAFRFGRSLAGISKRSLVAAVQSLLRYSKHCNVSFLILPDAQRDRSLSGSDNIYAATISECISA